MWATIEPSSALKVIVCRESGRVPEFEAPFPVARPATTPLGRPDQAIASYRRFLEQWKDGNPGLPDVIRVRGRLNALLTNPR